MFPVLRLLQNTLSKPNVLIKRSCNVQNYFGSCIRKNITLFHRNNDRLLSQRLYVKTNLTVRNVNTNNIKRANKIVGMWLLSCSGMVFAAVVLGGVTRLTESGLSMVTWKLLGEKRPVTEDEWNAEFERYKQFPEFKIKNHDITLEEFKRIYWMEYLHRMWGRAFGAFYAIPALYFWTRGYFDKSMKLKVILFGSLIGVQGLMGWYMVKSGLEDRFHGENDVPRVSQYRLASHLSFAFILYILFLQNALDKLLPANKSFPINKKGKIFGRFAILSKGAIFITALSGAFVAGLDAGLVYNSFPKMADRWIPSDLFAFNPMIRNFTENPTTVQFDHRVLGITTFFLINLLWIMSKRRQLPPRAYTAANALVVMGWAQVTFGILTLINYVPVHLAAIHQSGSLMLLSFAVWLTHELKYFKYIPK